MRIFATALTALLLATLGVVPAQGAPPSAVVLPAKGTLLADGSVHLVMKVRCHDQQQAFEWSVEVRQGTVHGSDSAGPAAGLITCDGRFQRVEALVTGDNGVYAAGPATVHALVQLYDAVEGSDVQLEDRAVVRLRG